MFAVCISYGGAQARRMQSSADSNSSQNDTEGAASRQSKRGGRQTRGAGSNQDWRQKRQHVAERPTEHMNRAESWNGYCNLQTAVGQPESVSRGQKKNVKPSKDKASMSVTSISPAAISSQSPAMPQPASLGHPQISQSMSLCL